MITPDAPARRGVASDAGEETKLWAVWDMCGMIHVPASERHRLARSR